MIFYINESQLESLGGVTQKFLKTFFKDDEYICDFLVEPVSEYEGDDDLFLEITILFDYEKIIDLSEFKKNVIRIKKTTEVRDLINKFFPDIEYEIYSRVKIVK